MGRFVSVFSLLVVLLFSVELLPWGQAWFVQPWTAGIADVSAWLMQTFDPDVRAQGKLIWDQSTGFAVSIEAGCNGVEAAIILSGFRSVRLSVHDAQPTQNGQRRREVERFDLAR